MRYFRRLEPPSTVTVSDNQTTMKWSVLLFLGWVFRKLLGVGAHMGNHRFGCSALGLDVQGRIQWNEHCTGTKTSVQVLQLGTLSNI